MINWKCQWLINAISWSMKTRLRGRGSLTLTNCQTLERKIKSSLFKWKPSVKRNPTDSLSLNQSLNQSGLRRFYSSSDKFKLQLCTPGSVFPKWWFLEYLQSGKRQAWSSLILVRMSSGEWLLLISQSMRKLQAKSLNLPDTYYVSHLFCLSRTGSLLLCAT